MKLNELHIADFGSGAKGHGDAVASRDCGVGGVAIELPMPPVASRTAGRGDLVGSGRFRR